MTRDLGLGLSEGRDAEIFVLGEKSLQLLDRKRAFLNVRFPALPTILSGGGGKGLVARWFASEVGQRFFLRLPFGSVRVGEVWFFPIADVRNAVFPSAVLLKDRYARRTIDQRRVAVL